jgi:hypothetical protein
MEIGNMKRVNRSRRTPGGARALVLFLSVLVSGLAQAEEVVIQNDSLSGGDTGAIQVGFVAGESAAAWLSSPCDGDIVEVQVFWQSLFGGEPQSLEDSISICAAGTFPTPGTLLEFLEAPVMTDGGLNEFRYVDEAGTIPLSVPVTADQVFIVSFKFANDPPLLGPSVMTDTNGCQAGKNAIDASPGGWLNACALGVSGDFVIRAVVDCQEPTGACCDADANCTNDVEEGDCQDAGETFFVAQDCTEVTCPAPTGACCNGLGGCLEGQEQDFCEDVLSGYYPGNGTTCADDVCDLGACCLPDGSCQDVIDLVCGQLGGTFHGTDSACATTECPQPLGACCVGTICVPNQTEENCTSFNGTWVGAFTDCSPPNPCLPCDDGDADRDNDVDLEDFSAFQFCFGGDGSGDCECLDMDNDNNVDLEDFDLFQPLLEAGGPA